MSLRIYFIYPHRVYVASGKKASSNWEHDPPRSCPRPGVDYVKRDKELWPIIHGAKLGAD